MIQATYYLRLSELTPEFIDHLKTAFRDAEGHIALSAIESGEAERWKDDAEYPLNNPKQHEILLRRMRDVEQGINLIVPDQTQFSWGKSSFTGKVLENIQTGHEYISKLLSGYDA
jgi:hypothetical protein